MDEIEFSCHENVPEEWYREHAEKLAALGKTVKRIPTERAEQCDLVICVAPEDMYPAMAATAVYTQCADCGTPIVHQGHAPKRPPKACHRCAAIRVAKAVLSKRLS